MCVYTSNSSNGVSGERHALFLKKENKSPVRKKTPIADARHAWLDAC